MNKESFTSKLSIVFFLAFTLCSLSASSGYGQLVEYLGAKKLPASVNSAAEESFPIVSPDNTRLYFVRTLFSKNTKGEKAGQDIWVSTRNEKGEWTTPVNNLENLNTKGNNAVIGFDKSGTIVYLLNSYKQGETRNKGVSYSKLNNGSYSNPTKLPLQGIYPLSPYYGFYMHPSEKILLLSMEGEESLGKEDLYVVLKDSTGNWGAPVHLGPGINTSGFEISPFLSNDGSTLYFSSNGHDGFGDADIYFSRRLFNSWNIWTKPENLGDSINSKKFDAYFSMTSDSTIYFASNRGGQLSDIYESKLRKIDLRKLFQLTEDDTPGPQFEEDKYYRKVKDSEIDKFLGVSIPRIIYFKTNEFFISTEDKELIFYIISKLENDKTYLLDIVGHTDNEGSEEYNEDLSKKRAKAVKDFFVTLGFDPQRIRTSGKGSSQPAIKDSKEKQNAKNRRVEINFVK